MSSMELDDIRIIIETLQTAKSTQTYELAQQLHDDGTVQKHFLVK